MNQSALIIKFAGIVYLLPTKNPKVFIFLKLDINKKFVKKEVKMIESVVDVMALVVAFVVIIKLLVVIIKPKAWLGVVKPIYKYPILLGFVSLVLAAFSLLYLLEELTIVQIFAVILLLVFLAGMTLAAYARELVSFGQKLLKDRRVVDKAWVSIIVWILLAVWVLYILFA